MAGIGSELGFVTNFMPRLCRALCRTLCTSICGVYAVWLCQTLYFIEEFRTYEYASFMRVIPVRRMFQVLLYAGFMQHFVGTLFSNI